jgi:hypothetical protein
MNAEVSAHQRLCLVGASNRLSPSRSSFPHERSHVLAAEPRKPPACASDLRRLPNRAERAIRLVRWLPKGLLPPLRPPPFLHTSLPGERLPRRTVRPLGHRRRAFRDLGLARRRVMGSWGDRVIGGLPSPMAKGERSSEFIRNSLLPHHPASLTPRTSSASRRPSPSRLSAMTVMTIASPGKTLIHHA